MQGKHLNSFQHALKRPEVYIGSIKTTQELKYVLEDDVVYTRLVYYNRGLMNVVREIGSNCVDHSWRSLKTNTHLKSIKVSWDNETCTITFWNDGAAIPIELRDYEYEDYRKKTKTTETMYPAEALFGEFLTGTNFDDDQERKTSGLNGLGAKISAVLSSSFIVDHSDAERGKRFYQEHSNNAKDRTKPKITSCKAKTSYTKISFIPDFERFSYPVPEDKNKRKKKEKKGSIESGDSDNDESDRDDSLSDETTVDSEEDIDDPSEEGSFVGGFSAAEEEEENTSKKSKNKEMTFANDYERDFIGVLGVYILEIAAVTALPVTFTVNGIVKKYHFKTFDKYVRMFFPDVQKHKLSPIKIHNNDECVIVESHVDPAEEIAETLDESRHISFVNGINTRDGGVHVNAWRDAIFPPFVRAFNTKNIKGSALKTSAKEVYPYITLFIRTEADKPSFDHNTKDKLNGPEYLLIPDGNGKIAKQFKEEFKEEIEKLIKKMLKWNFVSLLEEKLLAKSGNTKITKAKKRVDGGDKIQEAGLAGKRPELCTLYITEGMSAKALVVRGISALEDGQETNGILAIKGKFINIRTSTMKAILANAEVKLLCEMLNLKIGVKYDTDEKFCTLRYHGIRFATDMDDDGFHIRGLLINFFFTYWPELFDWKVFSSLSTAVTKVSFCNKATPERLFFSNPEFRYWYAINHALATKDGVDYLKGLGSITADDAPNYFINPKIVNYYAEGDENLYMPLGFDGNTEIRNKRKAWLIRDMKPEIRTKTYPSQVDITVYSPATKNSAKSNNIEISTEDDEDNPEFIYDGDLSVSAFVDRQLVIYHRTALSRALPNDMDGFKEGQRKAMFGILEKGYNVPNDLEKVMGAIKEITGYHHGAKSLNDTVVKMASKYPGSNNIALLVDAGEFGTRILGGEDHSAGRYIKTKERAIASKIFRKEDIPLLKKVKSDGKDAEYEYFVPVLNLLLVNGCDGIASGFSATWPNYNPMDVINWQRAWINGTHKDLDRLVPWYRDITGPITLIKKKDKDNNNESSDRAIKWRTEGVLVECGSKCEVKFKYKNPKTMKYVTKKCAGKPGWYHITDAPVGVKTDSVKEYLTYLESCNPPKGKKWKKLPKRCISDFKEYSTANFVHYMIKPCGDWEPSIDKTLKILTKEYSLTNMVAVDANYYPTRYKSPEHVLEEWCPLRLDFYRRRYEHLIKTLKHDKLIASNKYIFVKAVVDKKLDLNQEDSIVEGLLVEMGLDKLTVNILSEKEPCYDYLLSMQMRSMTKRKLEELKKDIDKAMKQLKEMKKTPFEQLWVNDMHDFEKAWYEYIKENPLI